MSRTPLRLIVFSGINMFHLRIMTTRKVADRRMKQLSLLIKPASGNCNLRCRYCFYHDITNTRESGNFGIMSEEILENLVQKALSASTDSVLFAFQGGEPTLAGLDFFEKAISFEKKYNGKGIQVHNAIQTNGTLIDSQWAAFLAENKFLTGVSLDGPKDIHDLNRKDTHHSGSFNNVMRGIELLEKHKVEYNILTVVSKTVAQHIQKVYNFFKKNNFRFLQFIPCLDPLVELPGKMNYSLSSKLYEDFLIRLFDLYYQSAIENNYISIRFFDNLVHMLMGYPPESCGMSGICACQFVVEGNGNVYPCDFYCIDRYCMGNIKNLSIEELFYSDQAQNFIKESFDVDLTCQNCSFYQICRGGCKRYREPFVLAKPGLNIYCEAYKSFYKQCLPRLQHMARIFSKS